MRLITPAVTAREAVFQLANGASRPCDLLNEFSVRVRKVVPYDVGGFVVLDPQTLIPTCREPIMRSADLCAVLLHNEVVTPDVNKFALLAQNSGSVAMLSEADAAVGGTSPRLHTILRPAGFDDELRVVFRANGSAWGGAFLIRERGARPFDADERRFLEQIALDVGRGLQRSLSRSWTGGAARAAALDASAGVESGALLLDEQLGVVSASPAAQHWLRQMPPETAIAMNGIALRAQALPAEQPAQRTRVRLASGQWLVLTAARLHANDPGAPRLTAVTVAPVQAPELLPLLVRLHGLSAREREVAELLNRGLSTDDVATQLHISVHTLRDHVKSIFAKLGVRSRSALMAVLSGKAEVADEAA
jgi:DNA-binding CsgD family transcriptional regulator